jgi:DNA repair protein RecN (Recombination protein N)
VDIVGGQEDRWGLIGQVMLSHLSIRDIVLIEKLDMEFSRGLSVLTGETGAGKSILLDALSLALGARGDAGLVRHGASQGQITAVFDLAEGHPARGVLLSNDFDDNGELVLRRVQAADGRSRVYVNDQPASVTLLKELGKALVEIHGQHDDRAMISADAHRDLLDAFGGLQVQASAVKSAWTSWRQAESALLRHRAKVEVAAREADYLRASSEELTVLRPEPGEETALSDQRQAMMRAEKTASDLNDANDVLAGAGSPVPQLASLFRRLERRKAEAPELVTPIADALGRALDAIGDAQGAVDAAMRAADFDPKVLERAEERLFALRAASRKFAVPVDKLADLAAKMRTDLADLDAGADRLAGMQKDAAAARDAYDALALLLTAERTAAAKALEAAVMAELPALKLERAAFIVDMQSEADARSGDGNDTVEYHVRTNPGTRAGPMMKVASGGELSRFLLALKVALADRGSAPTLVFDEIDTGVGGAVADAIGQRLKRLAEKVQVLSVTHAPQVAARSDTHFLIAKAESGGKMATSVSVMDLAERLEEIARMLSGAEITSEARAAAERLMKENAAFWI